MDPVIKYFNGVTDLDRILFFVGVIFFIWSIELLMPLYKNYNKWKHGLGNLLFLVIVFPVLYTMGFLINGALRYVEYYHFGLLSVSWFKDHPLVMFTTGFVLLDLGEYAYHYLMHRVRGLWFFHAVHHLEKDVDVSTTLREHPLETFVRLGFTILWIVLIGVPIWVFAFRQFIQIGSNLFSHSNFRFSRRMNVVLGVVFITPNLHHIHHHCEQPYTDKNFGDVLSIWDRLFGTFYNGEVKIKYGLDVSKNDGRKTPFDYLFAFPSGRERVAGAGFRKRRAERKHPTK